MPGLMEYGKRQTEERTKAQPVPVTGSRSAGPHYNRVMRAGRAFVIASVCSAALRLAAQTPLRLRVVASGFTSPVAFVQDPADRSVQFVVEQGGRIRVVRDGTASPTPTSSTCAARSSAGGEQGLLGLAFAPDYASSGRFFVDFTNRVRQHGRRALPAIVRQPARGRSGLAVRPALDGTAIASDPPALREPQRRQSRVRPGRLSVYRPGDGGAGDDPDHRAQDPAELLGKMLRIDVSVADTHPTGYRRSFATTRMRARPACTAEIWDRGPSEPVALQLRRPSRAAGRARWSSADVGQNRLEEIDYEPRGRGGRNYGWRNREGRARLHHVAPASVLAADRSHSSSTTTPWASRSPVGSSIAARPSAAATRDATSSRTSSAGASGRSGSPSTRRPARPACPDGRNTQPNSAVRASSETSARLASMPTGSCSSSATLAGSSSSWPDRSRPRRRHSIRGSSDSSPTTEPDQQRAMDETEADAVGARGDGQDRIRGPREVRLHAEFTGVDKRKGGGLRHRPIANRQSSIRQSVNRQSAICSLQSAPTRSRPS